MAVTSWAGANGFSRRMLLGTPCDAHRSAAAPKPRCNLSRHNSISFLPALLGDAD